MKLAGVQVEEFPATQVQATFAVFSDELETELKIINEDQFIIIRDQVACELGYDRPSKLLKNPQAAALFLKNFYAAGYRVEILENIVEHVTSLRVS